jgi:hypothetical protein
MVWVKVSLVLALVIGGFWSLNHEHPTQQAELIDRSDTTQRQRANAIGNLVARGVIQKLDHGLFPVLWTGPAFDELTLGEKNVAVLVAYGYAGVPDAALLEIKDGRSGKVIGRFSLAAGLFLY